MHSFAQHLIAIGSKMLTKFMPFDLGQPQEQNSATTASHSNQLIGRRVNV